ncbi:MAG: RimK family alpha-L-glutamate ligase [Candidatus Nitrosotenuis sp.]
MLTTEPNSWIEEQLKKAADNIFIDLVSLNPDECYISLSEEPYISYKGTKFLGADYCIPRLSEENLEYKIAITNHIEKMGVKILNSGKSLRAASNKVETQILLNNDGIKTPKTAILTSDEQLEHAIEAIGGKFPVIVKTIFGTHGVGVIRADSAPSLRSIVQQLLKANVEFMIQEFIEHTESGRIITLGEDVLIAAMRTIPEGDFRSNAHQGAELKTHNPSEKEIEIALKSAKILGINFAAVDYILAGEDVIVLEVNGSPGFEAMQKIAKFQIAEKIVAYIKGEMPEEEEEEAEVVDVDHEKAVEHDKEEGDTDKTVTVPDSDPEAQATEKPANEEPKEIDVTSQDDRVIGTLTSVIVKHFNDEAPIEARVDTGAHVSSICGQDIKVSDNTVSFRFNDTIYKFHLLRMAKIRQADSEKAEERPVIRVDIVINGETLRNVEFTVNERKHMKYTILLGRQTLAAAGVLVNPAANLIDKNNNYREDSDKDSKLSSEEE